MAEYNLNKATTTNIEVDDLSVDSVSLNNGSSSGVQEYDFPNATKNQGYYKKIPELKKAVDLLAVWVCGKGYSTLTSRGGFLLDRIDGKGDEDIVSVLWNMQVMKKINGDCFYNRSF